MCNRLAYKQLLQLTDNVLKLRHEDTIEFTIYNYGTPEDLPRIICPVYPYHQFNLISSKVLGWPPQVSFIDILRWSCVPSFLSFRMPQMSQR
jgi:hypothetical protein